MPLKSHRKIQAKSGKEIAEAMSQISTSLNDWYNAGYTKNGIWYQLAKALGIQYPVRGHSKLLKGIFKKNRMKLKVLYLVL